MKFLPGKRAVLVLLAVALWVAPVMAEMTTADLYFTVGNISNNGTGGLGQFVLGSGEYFADLHITVDAGGGVANFVLTPGTGSYNGNTVYFAFMGKDPLGLNVSGAYALTPANADKTQLQGDAGTISVVQPAAQQYDGFGIYNTAINTVNGGFSNAMSQITFNSTQTFANANDVLAALTGNYGPGNNPTYYGYLGVVDMAGYYPGSTNALFTGFARNGIPSGDSNVPIPPTVWLMGSGLVGLVALRRLRKS